MRHERPRCSTSSLPAGVDDPARPSGGNVYDRRALDGLRERGRTVVEHAVAGAWPRPDARRPGPARCHAGPPRRRRPWCWSTVWWPPARGAVLTAHAARLRLVVLLHMPVGPDPGEARRPCTRRAAVVTTSAWSRARVLRVVRPAARVERLPSRRRPRPAGPRQRRRRRHVVPLRGGGPPRQGPRRPARRAGPPRRPRLDPHLRRVARGRPRPRRRAADAGLRAVLGAPGDLHRPADRAGARRGVRRGRPGACCRRGSRATAWSSARRWPTGCRWSRARSAACPRRSAVRPVGAVPGLLVAARRPGRPDRGAARLARRPGPARPAGSASPSGAAPPSGAGTPSPPTSTCVLTAVGGGTAAGDRRPGRRASMSRRPGRGCALLVRRWRCRAFLLRRFGTGPFADAWQVTTWPAVLAAFVLTAVSTLTLGLAVARGRPLARRAADGARVGRCLLPLAVPQRGAARAASSATPTARSGTAARPATSAPACAPRSGTGSAARSCRSRGSPSCALVLLPTPWRGSGVGVVAVLVLLGVAGWPRRSSYAGGPTCG